MNVLFAMTLISVFAQCVIARLLTEQLWLPKMKLMFAAVLQFLGTALLMQFAGGIISGVSTIIIAVFGGLIFDIDNPLLGDAPQAFQASAMGVMFGLVMASPFLYLLWRVIKLVRNARATAAWQQGKT